MTIPTKFFNFSQNNSGGSFHVDDERGIGPELWIEATDYHHANARAEQIGLYWDGVDAGIDCSCCGDRWHPAWDPYQGLPSPAPDPEYDFWWHDTIYVHRLDGSVEKIKSGSLQ